MVGRDLAATLGVSVSHIFCQVENQAAHYADAKPATRAFLSYAKIKRRLIPLPAERKRASGLPNAIGGHPSAGPSLVFFKGRYKGPEFFIFGDELAKVAKLGCAEIRQKSQESSNLEEERAA